MAKYIELTQGYRTMVDDDVYDAIKHIKWYYAEGYARRNIKENGKQKVQRMHRFIMETPSHLQTDHINGDTLDNRKSNLRNCLKADNAKNARKSRKALSHFKGVTKFNNKFWRARIMVNGQSISLGLHDTEKGAAEAYNSAASKYFGAFAFLNVIK